MSKIDSIDEQWRIVQGFPSYEVSNLGNIRSLRGVIKGEIDKDGYRRVTLSRDGKKSKFPLHRLVAMEFVEGRTHERNIACHRDGNNKNNCSTNLKWATQAENIADKREHGTHQAGSKHPMATITEEVAAEIKRLIRTVPDYKGKLLEIARKLNVSPCVVYSIKSKNGWAHV